MAFAYDGTLLTQSEDALGNVTRYTYTDAGDAPAPPGLLETVTDPRAAPPPSPTTPAASAPR